MKKILLFSLVTLALMFLIVSCAPQTQQTNEERLTEQMHSSSAIAGMATRPICATAAVTNCRTAAGNIYFTYLGINHVYRTGWCLDVSAYNSRCISPTLYENCMNQCTGRERCNRGVCAVPAMCADVDGDGYRNPSSPPGCSLEGLDDCNDANRNIHPGAAEICGNGIDEDCSGADAPCVPPGSETICDNLDNNGNGVVDEGCDDDNDNYCDASMSVVGTPATCTSDSGQPRGRDCNDNNVAISPSAAEICGNGIDEDCSGADAPCVPPGPETICDNIDNNRNGVVDEGCDDDNDNYCDASMSVVGTPATCTYDSGQPRGRDCNDNDVAISPRAADTTCDGVDNNCDGSDGIANQDYCDGRDDNCDGVVDGSPTVPSTCPTCTDQDGGNNPREGRFAVENWQRNLRDLPRERVVYDSCFSGTVLNESVCVSYRGGLGTIPDSVSVDCSASGLLCIPEVGGVGSGGARCG